MWDQVNNATTPKAIAHTFTRSFLFTRPRGKHVSGAPGHCSRAGAQFTGKAPQNARGAVRIQISQTAHPEPGRLKLQQWQSAGGGVGWWPNELQSGACGTR